MSPQGMHVSFYVLGANVTSFEEVPQTFVAKLFYAFSVDTNKDI